MEFVRPFADGVALVEFQRELLARLPLADSVLSLLGYLWSPSFLDGLFDAHRGRCYEQDLTFPRLAGRAGAGRPAGPPRQRAAQLRRRGRTRRAAGAGRVGLPEAGAAAGRAVAGLAAGDRPPPARAVA